MGRPNKPTELKLVAGNPGKRSLNKREPDAEYVEDLSPPDHLSDEAKQVWGVLAPRLRASRLLTVLDVEPLEMLCNSIVDYRQAQRKSATNETSNGGISPWKQLQSMHFKQLNIGFRMFGMGPESRSRVMVDPQLGLVFGDGDGGSKEDSYFTK